MAPPKKTANPKGGASNTSTGDSAADKAAIAIAEKISVVLAAAFTQAIADISKNISSKLVAEPSESSTSHHETEGASPPDPEASSDTEEEAKAETLNALIQQLRELTPEDRQYVFQSLSQTPNEDESDSGGPPQPESSVPLTISPTSAETLVQPFSTPESTALEEVSGGATPSGEYPLAVGLYVSPVDLQGQIKKAKDVLKRKWAEIMGFDGVYHASVGLKTMRGYANPVVAIQIFVNEKRSLAQLPQSEWIPEEYGGFPTDVHTPSFEQQGTLASHKITGHQITGPETGTITSDFFQGQLGNRKVVLLTAGHVAGQPATPQSSDGVPIGSSIDYRMNPLIDAAVVRLSIPRNDLRSFNHHGFSVKSAIKVDETFLGQHVFMYGGNSGLSRGFIFNTDWAIGSIVQGHLAIKSLNSNSAFSQGGDSGSAILYRKGTVTRMIGILRGVDTNYDPPVTVCCHIKDVMKEFGLSLV